MEVLSPAESPQVMSNKILKPEVRNAYQIIFFLKSEQKITLYRYYQRAPCPWVKIEE